MGSHSSTHDALILLLLLSLFALPLFLYTSSSTSPHLGLSLIVVEWVRQTFASLLWWTGSFVLGVGVFLCILGGEMGHRRWVRRGRKEGGRGRGRGSGGNGGDGNELIGRLGADEGDEVRTRLRRVTREERYEHKVERVVDVLKGKRARTAGQRSIGHGSRSVEQVEMKDLTRGDDTTTITTATKGKDSTMRRRMPLPPSPPPL